MKKIFVSSLILAVSLFSAPAFANDRYGSRPPVIISPDLSAPWMLQLQGVKVHRPPSVEQKQQQRVVRRSVTNVTTQRSGVQLSSATRSATAGKKLAKPEISQNFLPQTVAYDTQAKVGSIIIDTSTRYLYLVLGDGQARRYGVGVGKTGFEWKGSERITQKKQWPSWRPPAEMIAREKKKGRHLPTFMEGGPQNPLGARALYLGSTLYRIHGTNQPWSIGQAVSSGCIRMRNQDVVDLYERVKVGAKVTVI